MKMRPLILCLSVSLVGTLGLAPLHAAPSPSDGWVNDFSRAVETARREGKPIFADFSTDWCGSCREMEQTTLRDPGVKQRLSKFVKVHIDGDANPDLRRKFNVSAYPTMVSISPTGKELDRQIGYLEASQLSGVLDDVIDSVPQPKARAIANAPEADGKKPGAEKKTEKVTAKAGTEDKATKPKTVASAPAAKTAKSSAPRSEPDRKMNYYLVMDEKAAADLKPALVVAQAKSADEPGKVEFKSAVNELPASRLDYVSRSYPVVPRVATGVLPTKLIGKAPEATKTQEPRPGADKSEASADLLAQSLPAPKMQEMPAPLINAGSARDSEPAKTAEEPVRKEPAEKKTAATTADKETPKNAPTAGGAKAVPDSIRMLQGLSSTTPPAEPAKDAEDKAPDTGPKAEKKTTAEPGSSKEKPAKSAEDSGRAKVQVKTSDRSASAKSESTKKTATASTRAKTDSNKEPEEKEARQAASADTGMDDVARWYKDGDDKLLAGRKKEAHAMYAKIVERDPENKHGKADIAFIKMVSLIVDRDDDALRKRAHEKIKEFSARFPTSTNKDYYTVIRAMLAADLGEVNEAHALLDNFPNDFPNSRYTDMAHEAWKDLPPAKSGSKPAAPARKTGRN
jgi:thioredoxin-like negative regulator of GroEL